MNPAPMMPTRIGRFCSARAFNAVSRIHIALLRRRSAHLRPGALSVLMEAEPGSSFCIEAFSSANRYPPPDQVRGQAFARKRFGKRSSRRCPCERHSALHFVFDFVQRAKRLVLG